MSRIGLPAVRGTGKPRPTQTNPTDSEDGVGYNNNIKNGQEAVIGWSTSNKNDKKCQPRHNKYLTEREKREIKVYPKRNKTFEHYKT